jgi:hypothetical protein
MPPTGHRIFRVQFPSKKIMKELPFRIVLLLQSRAGRRFMAMRTESLNESVNRHSASR